MMGQINAVAIDFETTGAVTGYRNEPWQIGLAPIVDGCLSGALFESLLQIGQRPFNKYAPGRHAQLREELAIAPSMQDLLPTLLSKLQRTILIAHNIGTERTMLSAASPLHVWGPWIDTLVLARKAWPGLQSYALEDLIPALGLLEEVNMRCPNREPHDALYDAVACGVLFLHLATQPGWSDLTQDEWVSLAGVSRN